MKGWRFVKLSSLANFKNGLNYSQKNFGKGLKVVGVSDFKDYNFPKYESLEEINPNGIVRDIDLLSEGDILFVRSNGNRELIGRSLYIRNLNEKVSHSGFTIRARFHSNEALKRFFLYFFKSEVLKKTLSLHGGGTNINNLNQEILSKLEVPLPPLPIQRKITAILSAYDDLIENNNRRIAILEKMAEELYREWFVRLRFPGHEKVKIVKGVPEGWKVKKFSDEIEKRTGYAFESKDYTNCGYRIIRTQDFAKSKYIDLENNVYISYETALSYRRFNLELLDYLIVMVGASIGKYGIVFSKDLPSLQNQNMWVFRPKKESYLTKYYLYFLLPIVTDNVIHHATGAAREFFRQEHFYNQLLTIPKKEIITRFDTTVGPIINNIDKLLSKDIFLKQSRDRLLSRLMSGKLEISKLDIQFPPSMKEEDFQNG
jgi:type I restriction enzyme S subunit